MEQLSVSRFAGLTDVAISKVVLRLAINFDADITGDDIFLIVYDKFHSSNSSSVRSANSELQVKGMRRSTMRTPSSVAYLTVNRVEIGLSAVFVFLISKCKVSKECQN